MLSIASLSECTDAGSTGTHLALFNCLSNKEWFWDKFHTLTFVLIVEIPFLCAPMVVYLVVRLCSYLIFVLSCPLCVTLLLEDRHLVVKLHATIRMHFLHLISKMDYISHWVHFQN